MKQTLQAFAVALGLASAAFTGTALAASSDVDAVQVATVPLNGIPLEVSTSCDKGNAIFRVVNAGEKLPSPVTFNIIRLTDGSVVSKRKMKLAIGQAATFRIKGANTYKGTYGLFMDANWIQRSQRVDATIRCS